jgi:ABC-2 type transport system permease protein
LTNTVAPADTRDFVRPGRGAGLIDVVRRRYLLALLVRKEVRVRYRGSALGWLWSYVKPVTQFLVFFLALGVFLRLNSTIENYPIYLFSGLITINLFSEAFSNGTRSLVDNAALIKKIYLPREMFPVASTFVAFVNFLPQAIVLLFVCLLVGWQPSVGDVLGILLGMAIILAFAIGLSMLFGSVNVSFRDAQNFVELIILVATWISPVLYQWTMVRDIVPDWMMVLYQLNPLTAAVELFHAGFWAPTTSTGFDAPPNLTEYSLAAFGIAAVTLLLGQFVFRRLESRFAQDL